MATGKWLQKWLQKWLPNSVQMAGGASMSVSCEEVYTFQAFDRTGHPGAVQPKKYQHQRRFGTLPKTFLCRGSNSLRKAILCSLGIAFFLTLAVGFDCLRGRQVPNKFI
jgi:hypothetical protein